MTNKDLFKILLCLYGYDRNINIDTFRTDDGSIGYEIEAENKEGDVFHNVDGEGVVFDVYMILDYMRQNNVGFKSNWWSVPLKYISDDTEREKLVKQWDDSEESTKKHIEKMTPLYEWRKDNNPCPTCTINKKDHWDSIHYNCELNHTNSCSILKDFNREYQERQVKLLNEKK